MSSAPLPPDQIRDILAKHAAWLRGDAGGARADLSGANLSGANLGGAYLGGAYLGGADLRGADLSGADLRGADLRSAYLGSAYLRSANLSGADLSGANLRSADLRSADLRSANLGSANLSGANLSGANLGGRSLVPSDGDFVAWKKLRDGIVAKLGVSGNAKRINSLVGRKCRAEYVKVLALYDKGDALMPRDAVGLSSHDGTTSYRVGKIVRPHSFDDDIRIECSAGIHFFITREEARAYDA